MERNVQLELELQARNEQMQDAADNSGGDDLREQVRRVLLTMTGDFIGEDVRLKCEAAGIDASPNAWGGLIAGFVRDNTIHATGEYRPMKSKGSHARESKVYRIVVASTG